MTKQIVSDYLKVQGLEEKLKIAETFMETAEFLEIAPYLASIGESKEQIGARKDKQNLERKEVCHFLYAIVFELAIKIIWEIEKEKECRRTHNILDLYKELSFKKQSPIKDLYDNQVSIIKNLEGERGGKKIRFKDLADFQSLDEALKSNQDTITNFKYDGQFRGKSSVMGSVIWNNKGIWTLPKGLVVFPKELLKYARELAVEVSGDVDIPE